MCKAFGRIGELLKRFGGRLHLPEAPSGCPKRSEGGFPATARRKCVRCTPYKCRPGEASKRLRRRQPLPLKFVIPVSRTQALPLLNRARVFYLRGGEMVSSVVTSGTRSGASVFSGSALRVPEAKRGRVPCDGAEEIYGAPPPEHTGQWRTPPL